ncbi:MAG: glycosyltransferase [Flavobacteriales bacterium]|nr:glycosyltransferase [Flavobacteriales bacterium]
MKSKKRILVAPLDWGIGHATRCIPIIKQLIAHNFEVIIAADGRPLHLLSTEFPNLEMVRFSGYNIKYPKYLPMSISMLLQTPKLLWSIKKENTALAEIIKDYNIDGVISDNRFGLYSNQVPCVFITHQLQIQTPYFTDSIQGFNYKYINKYSACWVMDDEENNLAGELSKPNSLPNNTKYIGVQSRFEKQETIKKYDFLAIVSGPEPQRTILEKGLIKALKNRQGKSLIVLGKPELNSKEEIGNLSIYSHMNATELNTAILESELIICRPGYSTVMDLAKLEKKAFFIPTPGQTEQEYLADNFKRNGTCYSQNQSDFDLEEAIEESKNYSGFTALKTATTNWTELFRLFEGE